MIEKMKDLVKSMDLCVLATVSDKKPHCSLMAYATDDECREIYMVTQKQTRKFNNLVENRSVSLLIDNREAQPDIAPRTKIQALTVSGSCQTETDRKKKEKIRARLLDRHPHMKEFIDHPDAEFFSIIIESFQLLNGITKAYFEKLE
jgi:general stress protein 26